MTLQVLLKQPRQQQLALLRPPPSKCQIPALQLLQGRGAVTCALLTTVKAGAAPLGYISNMFVTITAGIDIAAPWGALDLKRKGDGFFDNGADIIQFCGHVCQFWIANNFSADIMSWDCISTDDWDGLQTFLMDLSRIARAMSPFPVFEGSSDGLSNMLRNVFSDTGADIIQICVHICHFWIANGFSADIMPWECNSADNWDYLQTFLMDLFRTARAMSPLPNFGGSGDGWPDMLNRSGLGVSDFSTNALQVAPRRPWHDNLNYERKGSCTSWDCAVSPSSVAFEVARQHVLSCRIVGIKGAPAVPSSESFGTKSSSFFHSRLGQLLKVLQFYADEGSRIVFLEEYCVYNYVASFDDTVPSYPESSMQSAGFATHVLGLFGGLEVYSSRRIDGAVKVRHAKLVGVRQLPPLTADFYTTWARAVAGSDKSFYDRVIAGYFLVLLYGRFRFLDGHCFSAMRLELVHVDSKPVRFLVSSDERTKTSISLECSGRCLRVCIPVQCLTELAWFSVCDMRRADQGLMASGDSGRNFSLPCLLRNWLWMFSSPAGCSTVRQGL